MKLQTCGKNTNCRKLVVGEVAIYFSYETPIAVRHLGGFVQRENLWGPTRTKHYRLAHESEGRPADKVISSREFSDIVYTTLSETLLNNKQLLKVSG